MFAEGRDIMIVTNEHIKNIDIAVDYFLKHHSKGYDRRDEAICRQYADHARKSLKKHCDEISSIEIDALCTALISYAEFIESSALIADKSSADNVYNTILDLNDAVKEARLLSASDPDKLFVSISYQE
jgi:hypothetical protein